MTLNDKSVDSVLGTRNRGVRTVGADESTELWRYPKLITWLVMSRNRDALFQGREIALVWFFFVWDCLQFNCIETRVPITELYLDICIIISLRFMCHLLRFPSYRLRCWTRSERRRWSRARWRERRSRSSRPWWRPISWEPLKQTRSTYSAKSFQ